MRGYGPLDTAAGGILPPFQEVEFLLRHGERMPFQNGQADAGAQPAPGNRIDGFPDAEIHLVAEHGAGPDHFPDGDVIAPADIPAVESGFLGPDVVVQPGLQRRVVPVAAQERHRSVRMRVVQAGQERLAAAVDDGFGYGTLGSVQTLETLPFDEDVTLGSVQQDLFDQDASHGIEIFCKIAIFPAT